MWKNVLLKPTKPGVYMRWIVMWIRNKILSLLGCGNLLVELELSKNS